MEIIMEVINALGLVKKKKTVKIPKGKVLITIGNKKHIINNTKPNQLNDQNESE